MPKKQVEKFVKSGMSKKEAVKKAYPKKKK